MQPIIQVTATGEQHGLINVLANSVPDTGFAHMKPEHKAEMEKRKKEDNKLVEARYINRETMATKLEKPYCKYPGDPIQMWKLLPGHSYKLPKGFIDEVNNPPFKRVTRAGRMSEDGSILGKDRLEQPIHELVPVHF